MPVRTATAEWKGNLARGTGEVATESGKLDGPYSFPSRFEEGTGTNPEELLAAALAACFSMALSHGLDQAGHTPISVRTKGSAHLEKGEDGFSVTGFDLHCTATVPGLDLASLVRHAEEAKKGCPVSRALGAVEIRLEAELSG